MTKDFGVNIQNLINVAKNYINKANVDKNNNGVIEKDEVSKLLAGTLASSIDDLTIDNIHQKMLDKDTEKIFTAFMTDKSIQEDGNSDKNYLEEAKNKVESDYNRFIKVTEDVTNNLQEIQSNINGISEALKSNNGDCVQPTDEQLNNTADAMLNIRSKILEIMSKLNGQYNSETIEQHYETMLNMCDKLLKQIDRAQKQAGGNWPKNYNSEYINEIDSIKEQISNTISDIKGLNSQYKEQKELDLNLLDKLSQCQKDFVEDGIASDDEKEKSKELLKELIEQTSPMTRKIVVQAAENAYNGVEGIYEPETQPDMPTEPDTTSDINVKFQNNNDNRGNSLYYTLGGQPVANPKKPGIYIKNGKKVIIK